MKKQRREEKKKEKIGLITKEREKRKENKENCWRGLKEDSRKEKKTEK